MPVYLAPSSICSILTIIYKDHTKYNVINVNKSINNNNSKADNNNGKSRINTSHKREQKYRHPSIKNKYKMLNLGDEW